jgi:hypothetical protein
MSTADRGAAVVSSRGRAIRKLMARLAADLEGQATLRVTTEVEDHGDELLELVPHNEGAAPVAVLQTPGSETDEIVLSIAGDEEPDVDLDWIAKVVDAAVDGRVLILEGAGRRRRELQMPGGTRHSTAHFGVRGFLPAPGWTRRARTTRFQPYGPAEVPEINPNPSQ